jgi:hypothetical protein
MRALALCVLLTGCAPTVAPFTPDEEFLKRCENPPALTGLTGAEVMRWAEKAGPGITECVRIHNGLVTIIKAQK